jgi:MFS family permease
MTCGYVGCCDDSKNQHARKHFQSTGHAIIKSLELGEQWGWCFVDEIQVQFSQQDQNEDRSSGVIRSYLLIAGLYTLSASLIWGVNTLFLLDAGLGIFEVFIANAFFTGSMALFEIPTGVLADTRGRRTSFLLSVVVLSIGTLGYVGVSALGGGLLFFSLMSVVLGLGYTFYSGATEAWLVDALQATGYRGELDRIFARSSLVTGAAMLIGSVGGGILGDFNLALPFLARAGLLGIVFLVAYLTMFDIGFKPRGMDLKAMPGEMRKIARDSITFGWQQNSMRLLIITGFVQSTFFIWGFYAWQPYFLELLGQELVWVSGVVAALVALATMAGNFTVEWFTRFCGRRTTLLIWAAVIQTVAAIGVGIAGSFWLALALYLVVMAASGVWTPVRQAYINKLTPSEQRATVISFDSLVSSGGSVLGQTMLGRVSQTRSIAAAYVIGGLVTALAWPALLLLRRRDDGEDIIVGTAGDYGACAAQGVPNISSVDTTAQVSEI